MLLSQELPNAVPGNSEVLTLALVVLSLGWHAFQAILKYLEKQSRSGEASNAELGRRLDKLERSEREARERESGFLKREQDVRELVIEATGLLRRQDK